MMLLSWSCLDQNTTASPDCFLSHATTKRTVHITFRTRLESKCHPSASLSLVCTSTTSPLGAPKGFPTATSALPCLSYSQGEPLNIHQMPYLPLNAPGAPLSLGLKVAQGLRAVFCPLSLPILFQPRGLSIFLECAESASAPGPLHLLSPLPEFLLSLYGRPPLSIGLSQSGWAAPNTPVS